MRALSFSTGLGPWVATTEGSLPTGGTRFPKWALRSPFRLERRDACGSASRRTMRWSPRMSRATKAKDVVTALEQEMFERLATKEDLRHLRTELQLGLGLMVLGGFSLAAAIAGTIAKSL